MTNHEAAQILNALAMSAPEYATLSAEYRATLPSESVATGVPEDFPAETLKLFRDNPDTAAKINRYEENLSHMQTFGGADLLTPQFIITVLVLLNVYGGIEYKNGKWKLRVGYKPLNAQALKPVLSVVAAAIGTAGEGLSDLSETLDKLAQ